VIGVFPQPGGIIEFPCTHPFLLNKSAWVDCPPAQSYPAGMDLRYFFKTMPDGRRLQLRRYYLPSERGLVILRAGIIAYLGGRCEDCARPGALTLGLRAPRERPSGWRLAELVEALLMTDDQLREHVRVRCRRCVARDPRTLRRAARSRAARRADLTPPPPDSSVGA